MKRLVLVAAALMWALLPGCTAVKSNGSVEAFGGHRGSTLETTISVPVNEPVNVYVQALTSGDYHGETNEFVVADVNVSVTDNITAVGETFATRDSVVPRAAVLYSDTLGSLSFGIMPYADILSDGSLGALVTGQLTLDLPGDTQFIGRLEALTNFGYDGEHRFSQERLRFGIGKNGYDFGVGIDIPHTNDGTTFNAGAYGRISW